MVRSFQDRPVEPGVVDHLLDLARRAPSAGYAQGTHFVVLEGSEQTEQFWSITLPPERRDDFAWPGLLHAPVLVLPLADEAAYRRRYGEPDKARTGLAEGPWPVPYWHIDTAMATMTLLLGAVDVGLGALLFGIFHGQDELLAALGVPAGLTPIGVVALGHPTGDDRPSRSTARGRRPRSEVVHRGGW